MTGMGGFLLVVVVRSSPSELSIRFSAGLRLRVLWVAVVVVAAAVEQDNRADNEEMHYNKLYI